MISMALSIGLAADAAELARTRPGAAAFGSPGPSMSASMPLRTAAVALALTLLVAAACTEDQLRPSVAEDIVGSYYLAERSGGIAGVTEAFAEPGAPIAVRFDDGGTYRYVTATGNARDTVVGQWFMTDVARLGVDTFTFVFTNQLPGVLEAAGARLEARDRLIVSDDFPDGFTYVFRRSE